MIVRGDKVKLNSITSLLALTIKETKYLVNQTFTVVLIVDNTCKIRYQDLIYTAPTKLLKKVNTTPH